MKNFKTKTRALTLATMLALSAIPVAAYAGKHEQAVEAIAQARGKIEAGDKVGTSAQAPELQAQARAALSSAEMLLSKGKKADAIMAAQHAGDLADQAIVSADTRKASAERDRRLDAQSMAINAQQSAAVANNRADTAQQAVVNANGRADAAQMATTMANSRADSAQMATTAANAQADALRNAPKPMPTTTTVAIVEKTSVPTPTAARHARHRIVRKHRTMTRVAKTTTVTTTNP
jgi:hypothetical protein